MRNVAHSYEKNEKNEKIEMILYYMSYLWMTCTILAIFWMKCVTSAI